MLNDFDFRCISPCVSHFHSGSPSHHLSRLVTRTLLTAPHFYSRWERQVAVGPFTANEHPAISLSHSTAEFLAKQNVTSSENRHKVANSVHPNLNLPLIFARSMDSITDFRRHRPSLLAARIPPSPNERNNFLH